MAKQPQKAVCWHPLPALVRPSCPRHHERHSPSSLSGNETGLPKAVRLVRAVHIVLRMHSLLWLVVLTILVVLLGYNKGAAHPTLLIEVPSVEAA